MLNQTMRCFIMDGNILQISMTDYLKERQIGREGERTENERLLRILVSFLLLVISCLTMRRASAFTSD